MATRIFRVDLSEEARDFQATATEPGLAMLDRTGANYALLHRWLGNLVAEPAWVKDSVNFFVQGEQGRLQDIQCEPATKQDLEKVLDQDLKTLQARIKKAKAESPAEQTLHRIVRQSFNSLTADLEKGDHDCFFFKYREPKGPWKLVWCWGYQRSDQQPAQAAICRKPDCNLLFVRRENSPARCPGCETIAAPRKRPLLGVPIPSTRVTVLLAVLLLIVLFLLGRPKLLLTPQAWSGPQGSRVQYKLVDRRWFFFRNDVTDQAIGVSQDPRVIEFDTHGSAAQAKNPGRTLVSFRFRDRVADAVVEVRPPRPPNSIAIEPATINLGIGATARLQVIGKYLDDESIDLTDSVQWMVADETIAFFHDGRWEGAAEGKTTVTAIYRATQQAPRLDAAAELTVTTADYKSLELSVEPPTIGLGQSGRLEIHAVDSGGTKYSVLDSSLLTLRVQPDTAAKIEGTYLVGKVAGPAEIQATLGSLKQSTQFTVSSDSYLPEGTFVVVPREVNMAVDEYLELKVKSASTEPVEAVSSNAPVVEVLHKTFLAGRSEGTAEVTVRQGKNQQVVKVTVKKTPFENLEIIPPLITLLVGDPKTIRVTGKTADGQVVNIVPDRLIWARQPLRDNADFNRETLTLFGLRPTDQPQGLVVYKGEELSAAASVNVIRGGVGVAALDEGFLSYPPVALDGSVVTFDPGVRFGAPLRYKDGLVTLGSDISPDSLLYNYRTQLPPEAVIAGVNDMRFAGMSAAEIRDYFARHQIVPGDQIYYLDDLGETRSLTLQDPSFVTKVDVRLLDVEARNLSSTEFNAELRLQLLEEGEYRITDSDGTPLNSWTPISAESAATLTTDKIARKSGDEYELFVERKIGDGVRRFQLPFKLKLEAP